MKKHTIIYVVLRTGPTEPVILDSCRSYDRAIELAGVCEQFFKERNIPGYSFIVQTSAYYDE